VAKQRDLPPNVYLKSGRYYFVDRHRKWHFLSADRAEALSRHSALQGASGPRTLTRIFAEYKTKVLPTKAPATARTWTYSLKRLDPVFGPCLPVDVAPHHVWRYWERRGAHRQARHEVQVLSAVFTWAMRWGDAASNPCLGLRFPRNPPRTRYVTDEQLAAFVALAPERLSNVVTVALLTGLRQNDVLTLRRDEVTEEGILRTPSKAGPRLLIRWQPALRAAVDWLMAEHPRADTVVSNRSGRPYTTQGFQASWQRVMTRLPRAERFQFRDLRAKSATDEGDLQRASARLGHSDVRLTRAVYQRLPIGVDSLRRKDVGTPPDLAAISEFK